MMYAFTKVGEEFTIFVEALTIHKIYAKLETVLWYMTVPVISTKATREELNTIAKKYNLGSIIDNIYEMQGDNYADVWNNYIGSYDALQKKIRELPKLEHNINYHIHYSEFAPLISHSYKYHLNLLAWCYRIKDWHKMKHVKLLNRIMRHTYDAIKENVQPVKKESVEEEPVEYKKNGDRILGYNKKGECIVEYVKVSQA
jgi:hypothetical protein